LGDKLLYSDNPNLAGQKDYFTIGTSEYYYIRKDICSSGWEHCENQISIHGFIATTKSDIPVMTWTFKCKV